MGALFIADEMITASVEPGGPGRRALPVSSLDIVTIGKAFGGGFPLSGLLTTTKFPRPSRERPRRDSSSSYGGNPLAAAGRVGAEALAIIETNA